LLVRQQQRRFGAPRGLGHYTRVWGQDGLPDLAALSVRARRRASGSRSAMASR
jgi:hypothetical protein